jgi:tetratricopeptide (TPR) repeat protein
LHEHPCVTKVSTPWIVRKANGQMFSCPDQATLQTWIVEGRLHREDQINGDGQTWHLLGDSRILAPFFEAYDRAVLSSEITQRDPPPLPKGSTKAKKPPKAITTAEWMKQGEPAMKRANPVAFDELGVTESVDDPEAERIVRRFRRKRAARGAFVTVLAAGVLAGVLGYIVALGGPEDNPARRYAEQNGLLPGQASAKKAADEDVVEAHLAYARGDVTDLDHAIERLERARVLQKKDARIVADLGLAFVAKADTLLHAQEDILKEADANPDRAGRLRQEAADKHKEATLVLDKARIVLEDVEKNAPNAIETARALADYYRVAGDDALRRRWLERAHAIASADELEDPVTMLIDAKSLAGNVEKSTAASLKAASDVLEKALQKSPGLWRARLDLARIDLAQGAGEHAEKMLAPILEKSPAHAEAQRLMRRAKAMRPSDNSASSTLSRSQS